MEQFVPGSLGKSVKSTPGTAARGTAAVGRSTVAVQHMSPEERKAATLKQISDAGYSPWSAEMGAGVAALAGMGATKMGWSRFGAVLKFFKSPFRAMNKTTFGNVANFRAATLMSASDVALFTGGRAREWTPALSAASAKALEQDRGIFGRIAGFFAPLGNLLGRLFDSPLLKWMERPLEAGRGWRAKVTGKKSTAAMSGVFETIKTRGEKATAAASILGTAESMAHSAEGLSGEARVSALRNAGDHVAELVRGSDLVGTEAKAALSVSSALHNAADASAAAFAHESAAGAGVRGLMANFGKMAGRTTLFQGAIAVGVAAGVAAVWATLKAENKTAVVALKDMEADLGDASSPYLQSVKQFTQKQKGRRVLAAGASSIGEVANMAFMGMPAGGAGMGMGSMGGVMALQMGLPMLGQTLVPENAVLNAYVNLQKLERGEVQVSPADKIAQVRQLVGAVPSVQPHGGYYNKLCEPIAAKIVEQKLSLRETMQLLANNEKFTALAAEVKAKQDAQHPAKPAHQDPHAGTTLAKAEHPKAREHEAAELARDTAETHQDHADAHEAAEREHAAGTPAHAGHQLHNDAASAATKPSLKISASEAEHDGTVDQLEKAVGQN